MDTDSFNDNKLFYFFLGILIWAPLPLASNRLWSSTFLSLLVFILFLLQLSLWLRSKVGYSRPLLKSLPIVYLFAITSFWLSLQSVFSLGLSISPSDSLHDALASWSYLFFFCLALQLINSKKRIMLTGYVLVGSALFQAIYGSLMVLTNTEMTFLIPKDSYLGVSTGTFINRNSQAGYLVMCLSIGIGLMIASLHYDRSNNWRERGRRWLTALLSKKIILRISLLIIVAGLVMTHSRMGNSSFFIALALMGCIGLIINRKAGRSLVILLTSLLILDIFVVGTFFGIEKVSQRLQQTSAKKESRDEVALATLKIIQQQPLTGTGAGTFYTAFPQYRTEEMGSGFYVNTHNDYLEFSSEFGLFGTIPLGIAVMVSLGAALYTQYKRRQKLLKGIAFGASMSIVAMLIHALVDFNLQMPANAITFMTILAFCWIAIFAKHKRDS